MPQLIDPTVTPAPDELSEPQARVERRALAIGALVAIAGMIWVMKGVGVGMLLGALTAFVLEPLYVRLVRRTRRRWLAQVLCLSVVAVALLAIVIGISGILVTRGTILVRGLVTELEPGGHLRASVAGIDSRLAPLGIDLSNMLDKLRDAAGSVASYTAGVAAAVAGKTFGGLLTVFFLMLTTSFVLLRGRALERIAEEMLPLSPSHTRALIAEMRDVGRSTLLGSLVTGLAQGGLASGVFAIVGLPEPIFFGAATALASLLPGVGTLLVWVPAGLYLIATGHLGRGALELGLSTVFVIGFCDYVLRPRLVGSETMPAVLTFAALFGGVEAFGLIGLLLGPLLLSLCLAVLKQYRESLAARPLPTG